MDHHEDHQDELKGLHGDVVGRYPVDEGQDRPAHARGRCGIFQIMCDPVHGGSVNSAAHGGQGMLYSGFFCFRAWRAMSWSMNSASFFGPSSFASSCGSIGLLEGCSGLFAEAASFCNFEELRVIGLFQVRVQGAV